MKKLLVLVVFCFLMSVIGCGKSEPKVTFEEAYKQQIQDLITKKSQAIPYEEFYKKFVKDKSELQMNAQKEEWKNANNWPVIAFKGKVRNIQELIYPRDKFISENKDQIVQSYFDVDSENEIYLTLYLSKKEGMQLKENQKFKGYGVIIDSTLNSGKGSFTLYPVIAE